MLLFGMENFNNNIRDLPPHQNRQREGICLFAILSMLPAEHSVPLLGQLWIPRVAHSVTPSESHHKEFPVTDTHLLPCHCIPCLSVCLLSLLTFFDLGVPSFCDMFCHLFTQRWCHPEKSCFMSPNPFWFTWFSFTTEQ